MGASSSGQVITLKKGKSLFKIRSRGVFQIEISYEFTETKIYMQFQEQSVPWWEIKKAKKMAEVGKIIEEIS